MNNSFITSLKQCSERMASVRRPKEPSVPLKFGEYWVWNDRDSKYELWSSTRAYDGEKIIKLGV